MSAVSIPGTELAMKLLLRLSNRYHNTLTVSDGPDIEAFWICIVH